MGGDQHPRAALHPVFHGGSGQGRALFRVGAVADFIHQDERARTRLLHHAHQMFQVGAEGGLAIAQTLLVADVREDVIEDGQFTTIARRKWRADLIKEGHEPKGLEHDGFTAGVGPAHQEQTLICIQAEIQGHKIHTGIQVIFQQRMTRRRHADLLTFFLGPGSGASFELTSQRQGDFHS